MFEPIAITASASVLPGARSVEELWAAVADARDLTTDAAEGAWGAASVRVLGIGAYAEIDAAACRRGGYVAGFDAAFDPEGFGVDPARLMALDPAFRWLLDCGRRALDAAGIGRDARRRTGLVVGNLSYPSRGLADFACDTWLAGVGERSGAAPLPENRFVSGLPAMFAARTLGLEGPAFALDAACASSLYAVKLACDLLHDRTCDVVLAGGINHADDLFLHVGFSTLSALSASGRSRPLTRNADGLLPAEGAALLALKRLDDALDSGDRILAVIRGVGLSNDGSERGLLAPDCGGQIRAMRRAYAVSGIDPLSVGYVECHATGTAVGDAIEVRSMAEIFAGAEGLPMGALKANLGHMITASGAAAIVKILGAFEAGALPPTIDAGNPIEAIGETPMRLLARAEPWAAHGPRRAAVNAFGFGGNNAHVILEEPPARHSRPASSVAPAVPQDEIAVCGIGVAIGDAPDLAAFVAALEGPAALRENRAISDVTLPGRGLRFPPKDLRRSLGQQTLAMDVAFQAMDGVKPFNRMNAGVYFGMGTDAEVARFGLRWRMEELLAARGLAASDVAIGAARDLAAPVLDPAAVVGTMPNIPANRLSTQFDCRGPAFTVSSEELSGIESLRLACRALGRGEIDAALVGAVDLSDEPVHRAAAAALLPADRQDAGDGAVALVLKRRADAEAAGDHIHALIPADLGDMSDAPAGDAVRRRFGHAHAASGLLEVVAAIVEVATRSEVAAAGMRPVVAAPGMRQRSVRAASFSGQAATVTVRPGPAPARFASRRALLRLWAARSTPELHAALDNPAGQVDPAGTHRLAIVAGDEASLHERIAACRAALASQTTPTGRGVFFREVALSGEAAIVFAGANAYADMGKGLFLAFPEVGDALAARFPVAAEVAASLYGGDGATFIAEPFGTLKAASLVCQAHAEAAGRLLGFRPRTAIGLSSGETNALFAFGVWRDMNDMFRELGASGLYDIHLAGRFESARSHWGLGKDAPLAWQSWLVAAPVAEVAAILGDDDRAGISIVLSPQSCFVSGTPGACAVAMDRIGRHRVAEQSPALICHSRVMEPFAPTWARLHDRVTTPPEGMRFYGQSHNGSYALTRDSVRDALLDQARRPIDFAKTIEQAYADGVRVFVEAGPRNVLSRAIGETLGSRPHLAIALDDMGRDPVEHLARVAAQLFAAGVPLDLGAVAATFAETSATDRRAGDRLALAIPARMPPFDPSTLGAAERRVAPAPEERTIPVTRLTDPAPFPMAPETLHSFSRPRQDAEVHSLAPGDGVEPAAAPLDGDILMPPFHRGQLEILAGGRISEVFGRRFAGQDGYRRQVRMPMPPLLLADRVVEIEGPPGVLGAGRIVTETDIGADAWYLDEGRMPLGLVIESGQADLLLISWMGIDALNKGDRVYRLLGCEITFHDGGMPKAGDTLRFDIRINSHAQLGDVRMFFFEYDCTIGGRKLSSVRNGQAGFFSDAELAGAKGVQWTPPAPHSEGRQALPATLKPSAKTAFSSADLAAFSAGDAYTCFGGGFEFIAAHQRTPKIPAGRMCLIDEVTRFEPTGGPRGIGYLEAAAHVPVDAWFYAGHFHNDPCMPGTLMADAAVQCLAFLMAGMGMTVKRDGWRFEPVTEEAFKFVCRGQVIPDRAHELRYEVFVTEIVDGPEPAVYATLLCTSDGLKVFHCPRFGLKLVRDWPLTTRMQWLDGAEPPRTVRPDSDVRGDYTAMVACAWDRPSIPFGAGYARFDREGNVPRLPGPPYLFISRVVETSEPAWKGDAGVRVTTEYDVPADARYFAENDRPSMPYCVLAEVMLQPCGWLASYAGFALSGNVCYRNLDGNDAIQHADITPDTGTLTVRATLTRVVRLGVLALVFFKTECHADDRLICSLETSFGLFTEAELAKQAGLSVTPAVRAQWAEESDVSIDLRGEPARFFGGFVRLPRGRLRMIDAVTGYWPAEQGQPGRIRCRQAIDPHAWYFKAHFYEDPVQPGSLGLDALLQALKSYLILSDAGRNLQAPRVEPIALGAPLTWKYRGQVVPRNKEVTTCLNVTVTEKAGEVLAVADGTLWADGLPIYEVKNMAVRIVGTPAPRGHRVTTYAPSAPAWVGDHCPTYALPALPMMALAAEAAAVARVASGRRVVALDGLRARRWVPVPDDGVRLVAEARAAGADVYDVRLVACTGSEDRPLKVERHEASSARVLVADAWPAAPAPWPPLAGVALVADPYASGHLFHGPAFHLQRVLQRSSAGASAAIDVPTAAMADTDRAVLVLDAALHGIPHDEPELWAGEAARGMVAYPEAITTLRFFADLPASGRLRVEARPVASAAPGTLSVAVQVIGDTGVIAEMALTERLLPKGPLGDRPSDERRAFLAERRYVPGFGLSTHEGGVTRLALVAVQRSNFLPGTLERVYGAAGPLPKLAAAIAVKEHFADRLTLHPSAIDIGDGVATTPAMPGRHFPFTLTHEPGGVRVTSGE